MSELTELQWLKENPDFLERPATMSEFLGPGYLDTGDTIRPGIRQMLLETQGDEVNTFNPVKENFALFTGGIGTGKTTWAAVTMAYIIHWLLCLRDPQTYLGLTKGSQIVLVQMATTEKQAKDVVFTDIKKYVVNSPWFLMHPFDPAYRNQMRYEKNIWIYPGTSKETSFEGLNVFAAIIDEMDAHLRNDMVCQATVGYDTIRNRITSRFFNRGMLALIGQMKSQVGFAQEKWDEYGLLEYYRRRMTIWDSFGWDRYEKDEDGKTKVFYYNIARQEVIPALVVETGQIELDPDRVIAVPEAYKREFISNPPKALRDLAGIPPRAGQNFIGLAYKIEPARERWEANHEVGDESPIDMRGNVADWFRAPDSLPRVVSIDLGLSGEGDALGMAMGHVRGIEMTASGEEKPYIVFDMLRQWTTKPGTQVQFFEVRQFIYDLIDVFGFNIRKVTLDGFESTDTIQQLNKRRIQAEQLSVDKSKLPYYDLREAIYEDRIEWPRYMVISRKDEFTPIEIAVSELEQLVEEDRKIDHPVNGTKDVADAMAGVCHLLMGDRRFRRRSRQETKYAPQRSLMPTEQMHPAFLGETITAPIPPNILHDLRT
ncbi:MAG: hypothetical protein KJN71_04795 [Acidimicrobiia bacterium]|nr:hypothetical protein [Acidimicrobiia bacterium]